MPEFHAVMSNFDVDELESSTEPELILPSGLANRDLHLWISHLTVPAPLYLDEGSRKASHTIPWSPKLRISKGRKFAPACLIHSVTTQELVIISNRLKSPTNYLT